MSNVKISQLPAATSTASPDVLAIVQGGVTKKLDVSLLGSGVSSQASLNLTSSGDSHNIGSHPYTYTNTGIIVKDANNAEVFRLWASDPDAVNNFNSGNLYIGHEAGLAQPTDNVSAGYYNVGIGYYALKSNTTAHSGTAIGFEALLSNTTGVDNTAVGVGAASSNSVGEGITAVGASSLASSLAHSNTGVGFASLLATTTGDENTALGRYSGKGNITGVKSLFLGNFADTSNSSITNGIAIGAFTTVATDNTAVIGNSSITDVYFGSTSGAANLHAANLLPIVFFNPGGRLTTESGVPVSTSDRTSQGTLYYTPYKHNNIYTYSGSAWQAKTFSEISLSLTLTSGKNYDVFINSAATTLSLSSAWTNDTTRANALDTQDGVTVLSSDHTKLWLGTIRASGSNVTEDSGGGSSSQVGGKRFVWNAYNQVARPIKVIDTNATWSYGTATIRQANGASGNKVEYVTGDSALNFKARVDCVIFVAANGTVPAEAGIGLDSTTVFSGLIGAAYNANASGLYVQFGGEYFGAPGLGYHYFAWCESGADGTNSIFIGQAAPIQSGLIAEGMF